MSRWKGSNRSFLCKLSAGLGERKHAPLGFKHLGRDTPAAKVYLQAQFNALHVSNQLHVDAVVFSFNHTDSSQDHQSLRDLTPPELSLTNPVEVSARGMLLPMSRCNLAHRHLRMRSQRPAPVRLLAPELLARGRLVGSQLTRHHRPRVLRNDMVLEGDVRFRRSHEVGWCAGLL